MSKFICWGYSVNVLSTRTWWFFCLLILQFKFYSLIFWNVSNTNSLWLLIKYLCKKLFNKKIQTAAELIHNLANGKLLLFMCRGQTTEMILPWTLKANVEQENSGRERGEEEANTKYKWPYSLLYNIHIWSQKWGDLAPHYFQKMAHVPATCLLNLFQVNK